MLFVESFRRLSQFLQKPHGQIPPAGESLFRAAYGVPPKEYLTHLRLHKSMEFLSAGHSVSDSASMAGFPDLPNFSRQFKRSFGCNPSQIKHKDGEAR